MSREPGVTLASLRTTPLCIGVRVTCLGCQLHHDYPVDKVIANLKARGIDGEVLGVRILANLVTRPCQRCGAKRFDSVPAWGSASARP